MTIITTDKVWAIVPAAGKSRRMGSSLPKQYLSILEKKLIEITLERLLKCNRIENIIVALSPDDNTFSTLPIASNPNIISTIGGAERSDSVLAGLLEVESQAQASDWVLVHDAARCCIRPEVINTLFDSLKDDSVGGILAVPVSDTLKRVSENKIEATIDRSQIWQAQTPQVFRFGVLKSALDDAISKQQNITDEASAIEFAGHKVQVIMGHYDNIKVTHKEDLALAEMFLKHQLSQHNKGN